MIGGETTRSAFARHVGVSPAAVTQAVTRGRLHGEAVLPNGRLNMAEALRQWQGGAHPKRDLIDQSPARDDGDDIATPNYRAQKEREARARADTLEFDLAVKQARYRPVAEIERTMVTAGRIVRQQIDGIPGWADEIAAELGCDPDRLRAALRARTRALESEAAALLGNLHRAETADDGERDGIDG